MINTPIIQSEDGSGLPNGYAASAFAYGVNPEDDPELAMVTSQHCIELTNGFFLSQALRISMEEQRRVQEAETGRGTTGGESAGQGNQPTNPGTSGE